MVRTLSVFKVGIGAVAVLCGAWTAVAPVWAKDRVAAKRTIIESLPEEDLRSPTTKSDLYDYSVTRELLPPVDGTDVIAAKAGWVTVVEARDITTGSVSTPAQPPSLWFVGLLIFAGSILLFWRQLQPRLATVAQSLRLPAALNRIHSQPVIDLMARVQDFGSGVVARFRADEEPSTEWDEESENASAQVTTLLNQIEQVVARLKDGSPLRDVLSQELRLIYYRISAATDAARSGQDPGGKSAARFRGLVRELERVRRIADSAAASVIDPRDRLALPQTRSEAYALLGVNPDASPIVLKKLVDALRVTWHPDHARNESDRLLREERIKQINSAWDLISSDGRI